ncbi:MAG: BlaI/MecI/CopY family transcriptional regulator [Clostridia bacterium]|nr:BlaI/MecI/CopY family transcriptional regulator [Clostridia bacterium]
MENLLKSLPDSELKVMMVIWEKGEKMSTGEILSNLKDTNWKLSTLQIILGRLTEKGFLKNEKIGRYNYYSSLIAEGEYTQFETKNFLKKMFNNSGKKLIASLLEDENTLTEEDIKEIRKMLNRGDV